MSAGPAHGMLPPAGQLGKVQRITHIGGNKHIQCKERSLPQVNAGAEAVVSRTLQHGYHTESLGSLRLCCWGKRHGYTTHFLQQGPNSSKLSF